MATLIGYGAGAVLCIIGLRFLLMPEAALRFFGITRSFDGFAVHAIVGLRDLWLGAIVIATAWRGDIRGLGIWFALGACVCSADGAIVAGDGGPALSIGFHVGCGILCVILAGISWHLARADQRNRDTD